MYLRGFSCGPCGIIYIYECRTPHTQVAETIANTLHLNNNAREITFDMCQCILRGVRALAFVWPVACQCVYNKGKIASLVDGITHVVLSIYLHSEPFNVGFFFIFVVFRREQASCSLLHRPLLVYIYIFEYGFFFIFTSPLHQQA